MAWKERTSGFGKTLLKLSEGDTVFCYVEDIRESTAYEEGHFLDCRTYHGTEFTLIGHVNLVMKLGDPEKVRELFFRITKLGKVDRWFDYEVLSWEGTIEDLMEEEGIKTELEQTEVKIQEAADLVESQGSSKGDVPF